MFPPSCRPIRHLNGLLSATSGVERLNSSNRLQVSVLNASNAEIAPRGNRIQNGSRYRPHDLITLRLAFRYGHKLAKEPFYEKVVILVAGIETMHDDGKIIWRAIHREIPHS
jgi:hypothetical protein